MPSPIEIEPDNELVADDIPPSPTFPPPNGLVSSVKEDLNSPENEPAEMTSLKLELSTLSTSYSSLQSTLMLMQTQLIDLKRVNQELQEENESYMILLREKTLSGQFDPMKQVGGVGGASDDGSDDDREGSTDVGSMLSLGRSTLDRVEEEEAEVLESEVPDDISNSGAAQSLRSPRHPTRPRRISSHLSRGESLADLPITGPGLDLAAELGRAENKDILAENTLDDRDRPFPSTKGKRHKKSTEMSSHPENTGILSSTSTSDIDALRTEVKSLKDANKALSLYASKIIDRIIAQEGFEHVLAIDYDKDIPTPITATPQPSFATTQPSFATTHPSFATTQPSSKLPPSSGPKPRPRSVIMDRSTTNPNPPILGSPSLQTSKPSTKAQRRSLSFDWKGFSLFNAEKKPET
jgi:regulator of replication initiation timing